MKFSILLLPVFLLAACVSKQDATANNRNTDNQKLESYFETLFHQKATATVYIVHPEVCGACSNEFLVKMSKQKSGRFYLLATGEFKAEHQDAADKIKDKVRFIPSEDISRKGLSPELPQKVELVNGKIRSIDVLDL